MAFVINKAGGQVLVPLEASIYKEAKDAGKTVPQFINTKFMADADPVHGTPFQQLCASEGILSVPGKKANAFGVRSASVADILNGSSSMSAAVTNIEQRGTPFGTGSRTLFPAALIQYIEAQVAVDRVTDTVMFEGMVAQQLGIASDVFEQPVVNYNNQGGAQQAKQIEQMLGNIVVQMKLRQWCVEKALEIVTHGGTADAIALAKEIYDFCTADVLETIGVLNRED